MTPTPCCTASCPLSGPLSGPISGRLDHFLSFSGAVILIQETDILTHYSSKLKVHSSVDPLTDESCREKSFVSLNQ